MTKERLSREAGLIGGLSFPPPPNPPSSLQHPAGPPKPNLAFVPHLIGIARIAQVAHLHLAQQASCWEVSLISYQVQTLPSLCCHPDPSAVWQFHEPLSSIPTPPRPPPTTPNSPLI